MRAFILPADCASRLTNFWADHQVTILRLVLAVMLLGTVYRLGTEFYRLILDPGPAGAIDLRLRYEEVHEWFAGNPVYGVLPKADYPPASYLMLWPLLGWLSVASARWLWAITSLLILVWLVRFLVRESRMETSLERATVALLPLSIHGTGGTIGNGQLILHILPAILGALLILDRTDRGWSEDLLASALFLLSLVKLNVAAPFFWLVILIGGLRPALIILGGYVSLTFFSAWFQPEGALPLFGQFMDRAATKESGYANIYNWLVRSGLESWILPVSLIVLMVLGLLAFRLRHAGYWFLVGITAIVARLWTYHRPYDDFLILLPMIALLRLARFSPTESGRAMAGVLLAATWVGMLAPAHYLLFPRTAVSVIFETLQAGVWIAALVFLVVEGMRQESSIDLTATRVPLSTGA